VFRAFRPVAAPERLDLTNHFAPLFKAGALKGIKSHGREQRVGSDEKMTAGDEHAKRTERDGTEKRAQSADFVGGQHGETRQRTTFGSVERGRNAPYAAAP
jgi:hypothetical protein